MKIKITLMDTKNINIQMVIFIKVNLLMVWDKDKENKLIEMDKFIMEHGKMISGMELEHWNMLLLHIKGILRMAKK